MKIALVSPYEEPVPPRTYGGTELVVYNLAEELVAQGHEVSVFASGDSQTSARLVAVFERSLRSMPEGASPQLRDALKFAGIGRILERLTQEDFDIVHNHIGWRMMPFSALLGAPLVTTLHGPMYIPGHAYMYRRFATSAYISISNSQRRPVPDLNFVATVYNGIDTQSFDFCDLPDDYFAFLGRMSPEKGPVEAIEAAKACGVRLRMAAKVDLVDKQYFEEKVKPLIDGDQIEFIGEVDHKGKNELLKKARAVLVPINWEEPFGLVMAEALATGTPVIANRRGSVGEIVCEEVGFATTSMKEMCQAIAKVDSISRRACRDYVCRRFDRSIMARNYLSAYEKVVRAGASRAAV